MDLDRALDFAAQYNTAALITIRRDGRPQSSDISYDIRDGVIRISITDDRAKTYNIRRDPRVVFHLSVPDRSSYVSIDGTAELGDFASVPGDAICQQLAEHYEGVRGTPHPDLDEFFRVMVADRRLLALMRPTSAVGVLS